MNVKSNSYNENAVCEQTGTIYVIYTFPFSVQKDLLIELIEYIDVNDNRLTFRYIN